MADEYQLEEEFTMEPHYEKELEAESTSGEQASTVLEIQTPLGPVSIDMKQYDNIKSTVAATRKKASSRYQWRHKRSRRKIQRNS